MEETSGRGGQGQPPLCPTTDHSTLLCLCGYFQAPVPQEAILFFVCFVLFLQCLKVGGTSVKHPVTPSFLTAQGKWR